MTTSWTDVPFGRAPADLVFRQVSYLDVFHGAWRVGDVAVAAGRIAALDEGLPKARREIDGRGKWLVPGFIDAHVHVESSLLTPDHFQAAVLPRGTTTAVCDPHELANVLGVKGIQYFLDASDRLAAAGGLDLRVMLSSCVPATHMETNGGGTIGASALAALKGHPRALGLAEMMNVPGVLHADPEVMAKLAAFSDRPVDGHCPLLRGPALSAYAAAGITSCHESSGLEEAAEKLTKGIAVWIREGSVAKDLAALAPLLNASSSAALGFCTDDRNPLDIREEGHLDHLVRGAIARGVAPEVAYRAASWSVARHYGLDRGPGRRGAIAPGYVANLALLDDARACAVREVFVGGRAVAEVLAGRAGAAAAAVKAENTVRAAIPEAAELEGPKGPVHVIGVAPGKIITGRSVEAHDAAGVARLSVLERYGRGSKPASGYVRGFGEKFEGAIASSVGHDSHNLIVAGGGREASRDMRAALAALAECGGGFCVVKGGAVAERLALPHGGLMSGEGPDAVAASLVKMRAASRAVGCELAEPFLQLAFLSLPVIPSLKLTDRGLVDVERFEVIDVRA